jgi:hypothetical protein
MQDSFFGIDGSGDLVTTSSFGSLRGMSARETSNVGDEPAGPNDRPRPPLPH